MYYFIVNSRVWEGGKWVQGTFSWYISGAILSRCRENVLQFVREHCMCVLTYTYFSNNNNNNITYSDNRIAHCEKTLLDAGDRRRLELQQDYVRSRDFNMVRMGVWIYKNITWMRNDFDRDFQDTTSPPKCRPVYAVELCDLFADREEDVPRDIVEMAVDYSDLLSSGILKCAR